MTAYELAQTMIGDSDSKNLIVLEEFFKKSLGEEVDPSKTPWCAAFMNSVEAAAGNPTTGSLAAKSFLHYGTPTTNPTTGDIVVFDWQNGHGHVGFFIKFTDKTHIDVLGGNQHDSINVSNFSTEYVAGYRIPPRN